MYIWDLLPSAIVVRYVRYILGMGAFLVPPVHSSLEKMTHCQ